MLFANITLMDEAFIPHKNRFLATKGDRIAYVGETRPSGDRGEEVDGRGKLLLPGLVNAHSHAPMTLLRGWAEGLRLDEWLHKKCFPFEARMSGEDIRIGALLAFAEQLRFGVTSTTELYYNGEALAGAARQAGLSLCLGLHVGGEGRLRDLPVYEEMLAFLTKHHGREGLSLLAYIHGEYTSSPSLVRDVGDFAVANHLYVHTHLSETREEHEGCKARRGLTPAAYFEAEGFFRRPGIAAHCVHIEENDADILRRNRITAALNPVSNLKLSSGLPPIGLLLRGGVSLALGTDGAASNNSLNLWEEVKLSALLAKLEEPTLLTPAQALYAATRGGALAQGREDAGLLKEGYIADILMMDADKPWHTPAHDVAGNLVYSAQGGDVRLTMARGRVVYRDGVWPTLDIDALRAEAQARAFAIRDAL